ARLPAPQLSGDDALAVGRVLALAYPDRIGRRHAGDALRYQLTNGRGARLHPESALRGETWLVASELRHDERDALVLRAAPVDEAYLREHHAARFTRALEVGFERDSLGLVAHEVGRFDALVLERRAVPPPRGEASTRALLDGVRALGLDVLPWSDALRQWRVRVVALREWMPELALPSLDDDALLATLDAWLGPWLAGKARLAELEPASLAEALHAQLDHAQRRALDEHAPVALTVPSGQSRRLEYAAGEPPVLAVKLQELFGLADTPRIARDRVPVTLHLLSPAQRPIQVTQDLRGFWERTYPEVKRELKGRYPRHPWPDDPWSAEPTARAKRRG
ncbi:MAG TPA: ATP-dependent helicase C-terminal domain-containing protein, partial [Candidatus Saccharimonadia bacterium]|nr:ATP-dependent helicase C-terminal domain-containing protein [Candidatus Saccharimonadia bacterium]